MKRQSKKAFTLVELLVVIAILAILATVSIVGYSNFTKKANLSNDNTVITELNHFVDAYKALENEINTVSDAADVLSNEGFDLSKLHTSSKGYHYAFDIEADKFYLLDDKFDFVDGYELASGSTYNDVFAFVETKADLDAAQAKVLDNKFMSAYLQAAFPDEETELEINSGLDVGVNTAIASITYTNSSNAQEVVIRTNSYETELIVNAPSDVIRHYDICGSVNIIESAMASYHEYGTVPFVEIAKGRIALEEGSNVEKLHFNTKTESQDEDGNVTAKADDEFDDIIVAKAEGVTLPEFSRDEVKIGATGTLVVEIQNDTNNNAQTESDYIWLYKQGVISQIVVTDVEISGIEKDTSTNNLVDTANHSTVLTLGVVNEEKETQKAAVEIANNYSGSYTSDSITVGEGDNEEIINLPELDENNDIKTETGKSLEQTISEAVEEKGLDETAKVAEKEETLSNKIFNFTADVLAINSLGCGEALQFNTTISDPNIVWNYECEYDVADYTIFADGTLKSYYFGAPYTIKATLGNRTIEHTVEITMYHGGDGTESSPFEIYNADQFNNIYYSYYYSTDYDGTLTEIYYKLVNDIDFVNTAPWSKDFGYFNCMHIDGNNHTISNATGPLFNQNWTYDLSISNVTLYNCVSDYSLICNTGAYAVSTTQEFINVDVVNCTAKGGSFFLPWVYSTYTINFVDCDITNSTLNNNVTCQGFVAAFAGNSKATVTVDNCTMQAKVTSSGPIVAGFLGSNGTIKNSSILPGTVITQKGSNAASAFTGSGTVNTTGDNASICYATIIAASSSQAKKNGFDSTVAYSATDLGFDASSFVINADGSVNYTGTATISTLKIYQSVTTDRLKDGVYENGGFPTSIADACEFTSVATGAKLTNALNYVTKVRNVATEAAVTDKLDCLASELPSGLEFNDYGFVFDNGTLYLDANQGGAYTSNYFDGTLNGSATTKINVTVYFSVYDANGNLLGTVTGSYSVTLDK